MAVDFSVIQSLGLAAPNQQVQKKNQLQQDDFMKLLTTQLTHQDPLKPQESAEFLTQLAQFGTVNGIQELQKSFADFASSTHQDQAIMAGNLVGRSALVSSTQAPLSEGGEVQGTLNLPASSSAVTVQLVDQDGQVVKTLDLGEQASGTVPFLWDGKRDDGVTAAAAGSYQIKAMAFIDGKNTALETKVVAPVKSVTLGGAQGLQVEINGLGTYSFNDLQAIY
jgi:flagellar basal-body rod modification protein FlgD